MAVLNIVKESDNEEFLRKTSKEVTEITPRILTLIDDMVETMRHANGCGLAAVQVGVLRRIVVIETDEGLFELINPRIVKTSGTQQGVEGCLSLPGKWGITKRPKAVTVRALNRKGEEIEITGYDLLAKAMCHELDHLDGTLYTDKVIRMVREDELE
ncbi:MAG: peptide deformylase [Clostridia bacterium]|nr:peptide deformylase [Clostridia bacterium]